MYAQNMALSGFRTNYMYPLMRNDCVLVYIVGIEMEFGRDGRK